MKLLALLALFPLTALAEGEVLCQINTTSEPRMWDKKLFETEANSPVTPATHVFFVDAQLSSGRAIPKEEFKRRREAEDLQEFDGGAIVSLVRQSERLDVLTMVEIDASKKYADMNYTWALGRISKESSVGLLSQARQLYTFCHLKRD